jgi:hypothetical protein
MSGDQTIPFSICTSPGIKYLLPEPFPVLPEKKQGPPFLTRNIKRKLMSRQLPHIKQPL